MKDSSPLLSPCPAPHPAPLPLSSPSSYPTGVPELDLSVTFSPSRTQAKKNPVTRSRQSNKSEERKEMGRQWKTQVCSEEPVVVTGLAESHVTLKSARAPKSRGRHPVRKQQLEPVAVASIQDPSCLERVELNTSRALKAELQSLQRAKFDSQKALQESLNRSVRTKHLVNTRATEVVNVSRSQLLYSSLVSVEVQEDQLISQVLQDRLSLAPPPCCHGNKTGDSPSLFLFMASELLRQKPLPPEEELVNTEPRVSTHQAHSSTFDFFRRQRCHETTP